jgi:hypothetical protein
MFILPYKHLGLKVSFSSGLYSFQVNKMPQLTLKNSVLCNSVVRKQNVHLKYGNVEWIMPSLVLSLVFVNSGNQPEDKLEASTANPWFCDVMKQRPVP